VNDYQQFVAGKLARVVPTGIPGANVESPHLFPFQRDLVQWALRRGRAAIFAGTGLGKSRMQLTWAAAVADYTGKPTLIMAPLAVAAQTVAEGAAIGLDVTLCREPGDVRSGVNITNFDRAHKFDASMFGGVALDESSILKASDGATRRALTEQWAQTAFRTCYSATPSPNDHTELGQHAEFLGVCSAAEMRAEYFVHDGGSTQDWRLKGHARKPFWRFVASWAALVRSPADLGYDASAYVLPPLTVHHHVIGADQESVRASGMLFAQEASSLMERRAARKGTMSARVEQCSALVNSDAQPWVVWCALNDESDMLMRAIPGAVEVRGSNTEEEREHALRAFSTGEARVIISKSSVTGMGLNWQHCARQAFVGIDDSFERYYQAIRRSWRFGQTRPVEAHLFSSELEGAVLKNLQRKEREYDQMTEELSRETAEFVRAEVRGAERQANTYSPTLPIHVPNWLKETA
jgi:hypothetical protein